MRHSVETRRSVVERSAIEKTPATNREMRRKTGRAGGRSAERAQLKVEQVWDDAREATDVRKAYRDLEEAERGVELEAVETSETEIPVVTLEKSGKKPVEIRAATKPVTSSSESTDRSGWERIRTGNGEWKPGEGFIEGIKSWWRKMFGSGEKK